MTRDQIINQLADHLLKMIDENDHELFACNACVDRSNDEGYDFVTECVDASIEAINQALMILGDAQEGRTAPGN